ncbi:xdhC and CoxI family protein [Roseovarius sp. A-2]|uniref:XdhC family protein n=1 Tax=Roseovarius sp. A-2 TaxID=1570360 RepID=UPI0009B57820|nr:XdhC family protein [Roseovarius sp. A-2]GAW33595.1 xdhC and CoxI family protein [Roseovarius sp. A-2]
MAGFDIFEEIERLRQAGAPFCVATVIRTADATSAKAGAKAAVTGAGEIVGHLGGACVQRAVRAASTEALSAGAPRLISVRPSEKVVNLGREAEIQLFKSGCPSGGTVDLLIEPWRAAPWLMIYGATPIARALAEHGALMGFRVMMEPGAEAGQAEVARLAEGHPPTLAPRDFVVIASQGKGDMAALHSALATPAGRVTMVASCRKAEVLREKLAAQGVDAARLAVLKSPAGLNIGAVEPYEIALSILAEIVAWKNAGATPERQRQDAAPR